MGRRRRHVKKRSKDLTVTQDNRTRPADFFETPLEYDTWLVGIMPWTKIWVHQSIDGPNKLMTRPVTDKEKRWLIAITGMEAT